MDSCGVSPEYGPCPARWDFVEESFDDAVFLWRHRERALVSREHTLVTVARLEERLRGCLDGLVIGGRAAIERLLVPALRASDAAPLSVAAYALSTEGSPPARGALLAEFALAFDERAEAMARGLELVQRDDVIPLLEEAPGNSQADAAASLAELRAHQGLDAGAAALELMGSGHERLRRAVVRAARHAAPGAARGAAHALIELGLGQSPRVRDAAVESGLILGNAAAAACCSEALARLGADSGQLLLLAAVARPREERRALLAALADDRLSESAAFALGFAGTRWAADACIELMRAGRHAHLARESFCRITGCPTSAGEAAAGEGAAGEPDANTPLRGDEVRAIESWWSRRRDHHEPASRHVRGRPMSSRTLAEALLTQPMRARPALALQLALFSQATRQLEPRAWCREQARTIHRWLRAEHSSGPSPSQHRNASHAASR